MSYSDILKRDCCYHLVVFSYPNQHSSCTTIVWLPAFKSKIIILHFLFCVHAALWSSGHSARPLSRCESPGYSSVSGRPEVFGRAPAECGWVLKWSIVERKDSQDIFPKKCQFRMDFKLGLTYRFTASFDSWKTWHELFWNPLINTRQTEISGWGVKGKSFFSCYLLFLLLSVAVYLYSFIFGICVLISRAYEHHHCILCKSEKSRIYQSLIKYRNLYVLIVAEGMFSYFKDVL